MNMENKAKWDDTDCRYQDLIGIISGVSLRQVIRVIRATALVAEVCGRTGLQTEIEAIMEHSTRVSGEHVELDAPPSAEEVEAVSDFYKTMCRIGNKESMISIRGTNPNRR